jgi:hypothetical protein
MRLHPSTASNPPISRIAFIVLSFPLVTLVILLYPQYGAAVVMYISALVLNCYLWGYGIEWLVHHAGSTDVIGPDKNRDSN